MTKKIEQLTLNYANLASALTVQTSQVFRRDNRDNRDNRNRQRSRGNSSQSRDDRKCYNCNKPGHFARNCPSPPKNQNQRTRFKPTREVHYIDEEEYDNEEQEDYDNEEYYEQETYVLTRSKGQYQPSQRRNFAGKPIVDELEAKQRQNPPNSRKTRMTPASIESIEEFHVADYIKDLPCGLTIGQAARLVPGYRSQLRNATTRHYNKEEKETNLINSDEDDENTTAAKINIRINGKALSAVVDSGAATNIITSALQKRLKLGIDKPSKMVMVTANGTRIKSSGIINKVPLTIGKSQVPSFFEVLESKDETLILGNKWLRKMDAILDWKQSILTIQQGATTARIPFSTTKTIRMDMVEDSDEDFCESSDEYKHVYYSDSISSEEEELKYNPWAEDEQLEENLLEYSPAYFLANSEPRKDQNAEWDLKKDLHVGPLDHQQQTQFMDLISWNSDICASGQLDIGRTKLLKHKINTENAQPVAKPAYKSNPIKKEFVEKEINDMEQRGIIRKSMSPWASPVVVVDKKDGTKRFCVDYRRLNKVTKLDKYPLPRIDELLESFRTASWFTTLDLASGFFQLEVDEKDKEKTAFITHRGLYEFNVMPFGLCNAPATFQRLMNYVLQDFLGKFAAVYIDDIIIYSRTFEQHMDHIQQVFDALRKACLKIKLKKGYFCFPSIAFLGHIVGRNGIAPT